METPAKIISTSAPTGPTMTESPRFVPDHLALIHALEERVNALESANRVLEASVSDLRSKFVMEHFRVIPEIAPSLPLSTQQVHQISQPPTILDTSHGSSSQLPPLFEERIMQLRERPSSLASLYAMQQNSQPLLYQLGEINSTTPKLVQQSQQQQQQSTAEQVQQPLSRQNSFTSSTTSWFQQSQNIDSSSTSSNSLSGILMNPQPITPAQAAMQAALAQQQQQQQKQQQNSNLISNNNNNNSFVGITTSITPQTTSTTVVTPFSADPERPEFIASRVLMGLSQSTTPNLDSEIPSTVSTPESGLSSVKRSFQSLSGTRGNDNQTTPTRSPQQQSGQELDSSAEDTMENPRNGSLGGGLPKKRRAKLPDFAIIALKDWLHVHRNHPYPTEREKGQLSEVTCLSLNQVNNWFTNARRRILPKEGMISHPHAVVSRASTADAASLIAVAQRAANAVNMNMSNNNNNNNQLLIFNNNLTTTTTNNNNNNQTIPNQIQQQIDTDPTLAALAAH